MDNSRPHLTLVDPTATDPAHDEEFAPLPYYAWDERPPTLPLSTEEAATAIHLAHGDIPLAASLLKTPHYRLARLIRASPRLTRIRDESFSLALDHAASIPIRTLFNPDADQRALEWASTKLLQSRIAQGHPLSPAPPATVSSSLTVDAPKRTITFKWRDPDAPDRPADD